MRENIVLIGMPGAGKSTVGVVLAKTLGCDFLDTDILLSTRYGKPLQQILQDAGQPEFLRLEGKLGAELRCENTVVATGGSMVFSPEAMANFRRSGRVVYLRVPFEELSRRIHNITTRGIAFAPNQTLRDLFEERTPLYEKYADLVISAVRDVEAAVTAIVETLHV